MAILVNDTTPRNQYTATSGQTTFAYSFEIFDVTDIKVYNGSTLLTYASSPSDGTQYSVTNAGVTGGGNQAFRRAGEMGHSLKWIAISKNLCDDCRSRAGEVDTWDNWEARGMPASGWSICKEYCYCQLMPESLDIDDTITI